MRIFAGAMPDRTGKDTCCLKKAGSQGVWQLDDELNQQRRERRNTLFHKDFFLSESPLGAFIRTFVGRRLRRIRSRGLTSVKRVRPRVLTPEDIRNFLAPESRRSA